jgi:hypothetical protein|nr:MAG TPA: hypothetical protein [Caudoviricetes sp.]
MKNLYNRLIIWLNSPCPNKVANTAFYAVAFAVIVACFLALVGVLAGKDTGKSQSTPTPTVSVTAPTPTTTASASPKPAQVPSATPTSIPTGVPKSARKICSEYGEKLYPGGFWLLKNKAQSREWQDPQTGIMYINYPVHVYTQDGIEKKYMDCQLQRGEDGFMYVTSFQLL